MALKIPRLRHIADLRALLFTALTIYLLAVNWSGCGRSLWSILAAFPFTFAATIIAHNQMHVPIFLKRNWNHFFQCCLSFATGQPPTGIISAHNERHHGLHQSEEDFVRVSIVSNKKPFWGLLEFPFASIAEMYRRKPSDLKRWKDSNANLYRQAIRERLLFYGVGVILLIIAPIKTILFLGLPWGLAQACLITINLLQHQNCSHQSKYNHSRNVTGGLSNWFLFNNGYHTAHHLRPALHWTELPKYHDSISNQIEKDLNHPSLLNLVSAYFTRDR
jgi:fatty acid desaturase